MYAGMWSGKAKTTAANTLVEAALRGKLTEAQARLLYGLGAETVTLVLLAASKRIAELQEPLQDQPSSPSTPSGMVPIRWNQRTGVSTPSLRPQTDPIPPLRPQKRRQCHSSLPLILSCNSASAVFARAYLNKRSSNGPVRCGKTLCAKNAAGRKATIEHATVMIAPHSVHAQTA